MEHTDRAFYKFIDRLIRTALNILADQFFKLGTEMNRHGIMIIQALTGAKTLRQGLDAEPIDRFNPAFCIEHSEVFADGCHRIAREIGKPRSILPK